ncbi:MAG TPA: malto-oligosyltrehalose synthase [Acidimicrobiales bacterium]|nr:malto-oligosyltrehalose synthase [Acidimicrobiales bacterium]
MSAPGRQPLPLGSTYRLQLHGPGFTGACRLVGYLSDLGVQTLYVSPVLAAVGGSTHGYDVVDPDRLDPSLGTPQELEALLDELDRHGMRLLLDIVPNHMATEPANRRWWDVLRWGPASELSDHFDVDWGAREGRVLLPVLDVPLREVLSRGEFSVVREGGEDLLVRGTQRFPLDPTTLPPEREPVEPSVLLARQHYELSYWRPGRSERNYRRFFDVDGLIGVRAEDPAVYRATHRLVLGLAADERVAGLRVDHVDGLADPAAYLTRLRHDLAARRATPARVLVEKILARGESLPGWSTEGTTGYEFADLAGGLFVDPAGASAMQELGREVTAEARPYAEVVLESRQAVLEQLFPGELDRLATLASSALEATEPGADIARSDLRRALGELTAHLAVYRSYLDGRTVSRADRVRIDRACAGARVGLDHEGRRALYAVRAGMLGARAGPDGEVASPWLEVARRWQQLTGAVAAKGVEDTATYRFDGLLAAAEVGGDPATPAVGAEEFHRSMAARARRYPSSLNATSTHDAKRSEDVRARLSVLSEMPEEWSRLVGRWRRRHRRLIDGLGGLPDAHDELFAYQTIVGAWPLDPGAGKGDLRRRVEAYVRKAAREAKRRTSWLEPDERYERALVDFVGLLLGRAREPFAGEVARLVARIGPAGASNSLALSVLKSIAPGVPDVYQGTELWDFSLVDPDNRRPVDFGARQRVLQGLPGPAVTGARRLAAVRLLLRGWADGRLKLYLTRELLRLRRAEPDLFSRGRYVPLDTGGPLADRVVAFARRRGPEWVVAAVAVRTVGVAGPGRFAVGPRLWRGTSVRLPGGAASSFTDVLTGSEVSARRGSLPLDSVLGSLPVSVLRSHR